MAVKMSPIEYIVRRRAKYLPKSIQADLNIKKGPNFHRPQNIVYAYYKACFVNFAYGVSQQNNCLLCLLSQYVFMAVA